MCHWLRLEQAKRRSWGNRASLAYRQPTSGSQLPRYSLEFSAERVEYGLAPNRHEPLHPFDLHQVVRATLVILLPTPWGFLPRRGRAESWEPSSACSTEGSCIPSTSHTPPWPPTVRLRILETPGPPSSERSYEISKVSALQSCL